MRHDYALLFSLAALGFVFSRQQAPASSSGLSKADVVPSRQAAGGERGGRMSTAAVRREEREED